jgi:hypothetical protein
MLKHRRVPVKKAKFFEELDREKKKLNKLVGEALNKGIPFSEDKAIIEQNRKVDVLVVNATLKLYHIPVKR